jgi:hypothetical protein
VVPAGQRPGGLGERGGERDLADPGQRAEDGGIRRCAGLVALGRPAQLRTELVELTLGLRVIQF